MQDWGSMWRSLEHEENFGHIRALLLEKGVTPTRSLHCEVEREEGSLEKGSGVGKRQEP